MSLKSNSSYWLGPLAVLACAGVASTAAAAPPDLTGIWMAQPKYRFGGTLSPPAVLLPEAEKSMKRRAEAQNQGYTRSVSNMLCQHVGGPSLFQYSAPFEVMSGFGRIVMIFETEANNQPRTIFMNKKEHPEDGLPSYNGHSIGRWDGDVLVVDTVGFNGRSSHRTNWLGGVPHSDAAHIVERFSVSKDGKRLTAEITTEDPKILAKPWTVTLQFDRMPDDTELVPVDCEVDLDAFKTLDLNALEDADPEVARLLDDSLRTSDPALRVGEENK